MFALVTVPEETNFNSMWVKPTASAHRGFRPGLSVAVVEVETLDIEVHSVLGLVEAEMGSSVSSSTPTDQRS